jgi:hypothetical protein
MTQNQNRFLHSADSKYRRASIILLDSKLNYISLAVRHIISLILSLLYSSIVFGQYGNEWINYSRSYLKIQIAQDGIYTIDGATLQQAGFPISSINPKHVQLFHNGVEEYIFIEGDQDGIFDSSDKMLFFGNKNDGGLDRVLYRTPGEQPHQHESLYTDSSSYFLTWDPSKVGRRFQINSNQNISGLLADSFFVHTSSKWFNDAWFDGSQFGERAFYSQYTEGEGWMSSDVRGGGMSVFIPTPGYIAAPSQAIKAEILGFGKSDPSVPGDFDAQGNNHEMSVYYGSTSNLLASSRGRGYCKHFMQANISPSIFTSNSQFLIYSSFGAKQRQAVSYINVTYPRSFANINESIIRINPSGNAQRITCKNYTGSSKPVVWDLDRKQIIDPKLIGTNLEFRIDKSGSNDLLIADSATIFIKLSAAQLKLKTFTKFNFNAGTDYLIITNKTLSQGATEYANYRSSAIGGGNNVSIVYVDELFDQYYYGVHHPMALKNFIKAVYEQNNAKINSLFLLGKGQSYYLYSNDESRRIGLDLVPTMGYPPSDHLFTIGLGARPEVPEIAIGRLPAKNNAEITLYLNKVKTHELTLNQSDLWKKQVVHLSGGTKKSENIQFSGYLNDYAKIIASDSFGGQTKLYSKDEINVVQENLTTAVIGSIDKGASMMNYFGHGSSNVLEIDLGFPNQYKNQGKYPLFYFNGCILGNSFDISSLAEKFLLDNDAGAVNWLASSSYSFTTTLYNYGYNFHQKMFRTDYGASVGEIIRKTTESYISSSDDYKMAMCYQFLCHGDPSICYFSPNRADFTFGNANTRINPPFFAANVDSVNLDLHVLNLGKTGSDTLEISLRRTNSSGYSKNYSYQFRAPLYDSIFVVRLENSDTFKGLNNLFLQLDPRNKISENPSVGELNNTMQLEVFFPRDNVFIYEPRNNDIVTTTKVDLVVHAGEKSETIRSVDFELDTSINFNSSALMQATASGLNEISVRLNLLAKDSIDYYWRAKLQGSGNNDWVVGNFAMIFGNQTGASQENVDLVSRGKYERIWADTLGEFHFSTTTSQQYHIQASGAQGNFRRGIRINGYLARMFWMVNNGIQVIAINSKDESRLMLSTQFHTTSPRDPLGFGYAEKVNDPYYIVGNYTGVYEFNTTIKEHRDSFLVFLNNVPDDYYLFIYNGVNTGIEDWETPIFAKLAEFGIDQLKDHVKESQPFALKGYRLDPRDALQSYGDTNNLVIPANRQDISLTTNLSIPHSEGSITTEIVGPALNWGQSYFDLRPNTADGDSVWSEIWGVDKQGAESILLKQIGRGQNLSSIDAGIYPYVKLRMHFSDSIHRTPVQLRRWLVSYDPAPDGLLANAGLTQDSIKQGQLLIVNSSFRNMGKVAFDSSEVVIRVYNSINELIHTINAQTPRIDIDSSLFRSDTISTDGLIGAGRIVINYNPNKTPAEPEYGNNTAIMSFYIKPFQSNALGDLRVDGRIIMDEELVSSEPEINLLVYQQDSFVFYDDVSYYELYLKYPGEDTFRTIDVFSPNIEFIPAQKTGAYHSLIYNSPGLENGTYEVKAIIKNPVISGREDEVKARFKIVNEVAVSNVYFYPNPFTTQAQIVYTLTGNDIPEIFRIDIYTVSGHRVKSIDLHVEDDLQIGTHLTKYRWHGTDQYGDQLANGVYLYKTTVLLNGKAPEHYDQSNDHLFNQGFGKLYLMR